MKSPEVQTNFVIVKPSEHVSPPPFIDVEKAAESYEAAKKYISSFIKMKEEEAAEKQDDNEDSNIIHGIAAESPITEQKAPTKPNQFHSPALTLALSLTLYNRPDSAETVLEDEQLQRQCNRLIQSEMHEAQDTSHLPTIGWEVEAPVLPYNSQTRGDGMYSHLEKFSQAIGLPKNNINSLYKHIQNFSYWEYTSQPAFSTEVSTRILAELINGRFIPTLNNSTDPNLISDYLSECLISLHINIGIPSLGKNNKTLWLEMRDEGKYLAALMALGFTSPLRLEKKKTRLLADFKEAEFTVKPGTHRLEMKGLEMRTPASYKQFEYAQLLSAALFASYTQSHESLGGVWESLRQETLPILPSEDVVFSQDTDDISKKNVLRRMEDSDAQRQTREILTRHVNWVRRILREQP